MSNRLLNLFELLLEDQVQIERTQKPRRQAAEHVRARRLSQAVAAKLRLPAPLADELSTDDRKIVDACAQQVKQRFAANKKQHAEMVKGIRLRRSRERDEKRRKTIDAQLVRLNQDSPPEQPSEELIGDVVWARLRSLDSSPSSRRSPSSDQVPLDWFATLWEVGVVELRRKLAGLGIEVDDDRIRRHVVHWKRDSLPKADTSLAGAIEQLDAQGVTVPLLEILIDKNPADAERCNLPGLLKFLNSNSSSKPGEKGKRGRKPRYSKQEKKIVLDAWKGGRGAFKTTYDLANDLGDGWTASKVQKIIDTARPRKNKRKNGDSEK